MRVLIAIPFLLIFVLFALSNTEPVLLAFWPTDYALQVPLSVAILAAMAVAFVIGAFLTWVTALGARGRARAAERAVRDLREEVAELREREARQRNVPALGCRAALPPPRA